MKVIKLTLVLLFAMTANLAYSQIGVRAGVNIATQSVDKGDDCGSLIGLNLGLLYELVLTDNLSIQPEIHFIQKGSMVDIHGWAGSVEVSTRLNYLELAVMGKFNILDIGRHGGLYLGLTPYLGYGLNGVTKFDDESESEDIDFDDDEINRMDYGVGFGVGASYGRLFLDVRYNLGLSNFDNSALDIDIKNRGILIGLGYKF